MTITVNANIRINMYHIESFDLDMVIEDCQFRKSMETP